VAERPQVYRTGKVERLEHHRERYEKAGVRDQIQAAMDYTRAMHDLLVDMNRKLDNLTNKVEAMEQRQSRGGG
jgi:hypothetical protein